MSSPLNPLRDPILDAWKTNNRVTVFLVERLPAELWRAKVTEHRVAPASPLTERGESFCCASPTRVSRRVGMGDP